MTTFNSNNGYASINNQGYIPSYQSVNTSITWSNVNGPNLTLDIDKDSGDLNVNNGINAEYFMDKYFDERLDVMIEAIIGLLLEKGIVKDTEEFDEFVQSIKMLRTLGSGSSPLRK